jgi:hypothetical protein
MKKAQAEQLKRRHSRRLLGLAGVCGVGIERGDRKGDYALVVHLEDDNPDTRAAVQKEVAAGGVRIVRSGKFRKL